MGRISSSFLAKFVWLVLVVLAANAFRSLQGGHSHYQEFKLLGTFLHFEIE